MRFARDRTGFVQRVMATLLLTAILVDCATPISRVRVVLKSAKASTPVLFDQGLTALDPQQIPQKWTNEYCGTCHPAEFAQWKQSLHSRAGTNDNFRAQFLNPDKGRDQWCLNCHAPINPGFGNFATQEPQGIDEAFESRTAWLANGVDCLSCHVRDGKVLVTRATEKAAKHHPIRVAPDLGTAEFCGGCHQFGVKVSDSPDLLDPPLQQASLEEFLEYRAAGGSETRCHDCHMPGGDHLMPGGYSIPMVRQAVDLELSAQWIAQLRSVLLVVEIRAGHVGHRVPGGEHLFRVMTVHTVLEEHDGRAIQSSATIQPVPDDIASRFGIQNAKQVTRWPQVETFRHERGASAFDAAPDTRLRPGEVRRFEYLLKIDPVHMDTTVRARARIVYHVLDETDSRSHGFSPESMRWVVISQESALTLGNGP